MAEIYVTSTADSGAGSLRQAIADASDGDVILFDSDVFPQGQTTSILLSSYIAVNKSVGIYGGESDGAGGYTSGASKRYYVYREVEDVKTKTYIDDNPALENETVLFENVCRVALNGQDAVRLLYQQQDKIIIYSGISFTNAHGPSGSSGGAAQIQRGQTVFRDCDFSVCHSEVQGGAVAAVSNDPVVNFFNCNFVSCSAPNGGALTASATSQITTNACIFDGCSASSGGCLTARVSGQITLNNCIFYGNSATVNGGVAYIADTSQCDLNNCIITSCNASAAGSVGYFTVNSLANLSDCTISDCGANYGGGVYTGGSSQVTLIRCAVSDCMAETYGGGICAHYSSHTTLTDCTISNCSTKNNGGGIYALSSSSVAIYSCNIDGCHANTGGGIYIGNSSQNIISGCIITNCNANGNGGGITLGSTSQSAVNDCTITGCTALHGSGIFAFDTSQNVITNCVISDNTAKQTGGGSYVRASSQNTLNNCTITGNTSEQDVTKRDVIIGENSVAIINGSKFGALRIVQTTQVTVQSGITTVDTLTLLNDSGVYVTLTIADGAALTITTSATIGAATFTSEGRGYFAVGAGIDISAAAFENVVLCAYGADVSSFAEVDGVLEWDADDPSVSVLIEREDNDAWTTLAQTTGESLDYYLPPKVNLRLFDGERFLTTATPDSRTYFYIGGAEGSFDDAEDWSLTKDGTAIPQSPTITDCAFVIQGAEGNVAISKGSANVTGATIIPAGTNDIAVVVDEATVLAGTERFTGTLTTTGDVAITGDASKLAIIVDGTLEVAGSLKLATLTLTSGSSVVFASADDVLVVTGSATVNDATFSCEEPTAYFTAPVGTDLTQATFTNVYVATKGAEVVSVTGARFGKNYSINIISEDNTLPVTVEYRLEGTNDWIVADPAFVGTTFQIRLDDDATFRVYNGEKFTEATMKVYGLYNEMAAIVEIGYLI